MKVTIIYHCAIMEFSKAFYRALSREGVEVTVIVPNIAVNARGYSPEHIYRYSAKHDETTFRYIPVALVSARHYNWGFHPAKLIRALKQSDPDLIQVFNEFHCFPVTQVLWVRNKFLNRNVPVMIYGFQNMDYVKMQTFSRVESLKNHIRRRLIGYNLKHLQGALVATQEAVDIIASYQTKVRVRKLFWGVEAETFYPKDKRTCREALHLPAEKKIIGYFGRMEQEKGLDDILDALGELQDVVLLLIGDGTYLEEVLRKSRRMGVSERIISRRAVAACDLNDYFNSLDAFILASRTMTLWKEQYGRVLVEAMFCGVPIAGSSSGAIPEILSEYPRHVIFPEKDIPALVKAVKKMIDDPRQGATNGNLNVFKSQHFVREHIQFFKDLMEPESLISNRQDVEAYS